MTTHHPASTDPTVFGLRQHATFVAVAFAIWLTGVAVVRLLPSAALDVDEPWPILLFVASIALGVGIQLAAPFVLGLELRDTFVPLMVISGSALMMDGVAIAFTDIYSSDTATKLVVGGWLLWTFGTQVIITVVMTGRVRGRTG